MFRYGHRSSDLALGVATIAALATMLVAPAPAAVAEDVGSPSQDRVGLALEILRQSPATDDLPDVLAAHNVSIRFVPMAPNLYARYSVQRHAVEIDARWSDADTLTIATVLAHEATHARDAVSGFLASGGATACIESEVRAFRVSAALWTEVHGPTGKLNPSDELERQLNLIAERYVRDPAGLDGLVRQAYTDQCGTAA